MKHEEKISKFMNIYQHMEKTPYGNQRDFLLGICYCQTGDFEKAKLLFESSCVAMFSPPMLWSMTGQPNWLIDISVLSGRIDLLSDVFQELKQYKKGNLGNSYVALYAYKMIEFLYPDGGSLLASLDGLIKQRKIKDAYAMGECLEAITTKDAAKFNSSLSELLDTHHKQASHGGLRETAEGLLCMPAMSLTYVAKLFNLKVEIKNNYLSLAYLDYLRTLLGAGVCTPPNVSHTSKGTGL